MGEPRGDKFVKKKCFFLQMILQSALTYDLENVFDAKCLAKHAGKLKVPLHPAPFVVNVVIIVLLVGGSQERAGLTSRERKEATNQTPGGGMQSCAHRECAGSRLQ